MNFIFLGKITLLVYFECMNAHTEDSQVNASIILSIGTYQSGTIIPEQALVRLSRDAIFKRK